MQTNPLKLGVNIDHAATLREQRKENDPCLLEVAKCAIQNGADGITIHLREDRRHIQDQDVVDIRFLDTHLNLEMAATDEMVTIATSVVPNAVCLVPEKREELTTEGGLDICRFKKDIMPKVECLKKAGIQVSLFIDPDFEQIQASKDVGAHCIELHTGHYAHHPSSTIDSIRKAAFFADSLGLIVHAGHGLNRGNLGEIAKINVIQELNIGHSLISRSLFIGLAEAIKEIKDKINLFRTT